MPAPRLLPVTMAAIGLVLALKSAAVLRGLLPDAGPAAGLLLSQAFASAAPAPAPPPPPVSQRAVPPAPKAAPPPPPPAEVISEQERALLLDLRQRRAEIDARAAQLATQEATLAATEKRIAARIAELGSLQARLEAMEQARREHDEANWRGLVKLYESMKPREAAAIFNDLDKPVLLAVLDRMKEARAAPILAAMAPERARQVTADLAGQRAAATRAPGNEPPLKQGSP
jgi:flagellar motility protein MotE (MotC chaperone)